MDREQNETSAMYTENQAESESNCSRKLKQIVDIDHRSKKSACIGRMHTLHGCLLD